MEVMRCFLFFLPFKIGMDRFKDFSEHREVVALRIAATVCEQFHV